MRLMADVDEPGNNERVETQCLEWTTKCPEASEHRKLLMTQGVVEGGKDAKAPGQSVEHHEHG